MCDCGCDALPWVRTDIAEAPPAPTHSIMWPNRRPFDQTAPQQVQVKHPAVIESVNALPGGTLVAWPRVGPGTAFARSEFYRGAAGGGDDRVRLTLPFPGDWLVQAEAAAGAGEYVIKDICGIAGALAFGGVRIIGGAVAPAAVPLTMSAPTFATVGVASALALAANPARRFLSLQNTHATGIIYLGWGANAAVVGSGIPITPGNFKSFNQPGEDLSREALNAISTVAASNLAIQEAI
jgi:hypothetical protein